MMRRTDRISIRSTDGLLCLRAGGIQDDEDFCQQLCKIVGPDCGALDPELLSVKLAMEHIKRERSDNSACGPQDMNPSPHSVDSIYASRSSTHQVTNYDGESPTKRARQSAWHPWQSSASESGSSDDMESSTGAAVIGETRLKIQFENKGFLGSHPQRFGKSGLFIPDGICGTHEMYEQTWRFRVTLEKTMVTRTDLKLVTYSVTNLCSGTTLSVTETSKQAQVRQDSGRTICNRVLKRALEVRCQELEEQLRTEDYNSTRSANIRDLIRIISPKRCTMGILFFGLLHRSVQDPLLAEYNSRLAMNVDHLVNDTNKRFL